MYLIYKVFLPSSFHTFIISNFLLHPIHLSLTYDILKHLLLILHLVLAETWPNETKGSFPLFMNSFISFNHCSHYGNILQGSH